MAKYCVKCGSPLENGKCPICDGYSYSSVEEHHYKFYKRDFLWFIVLALIIGTSIICSENSPFYYDIQSFVWRHFDDACVITKVENYHYDNVTYSLNKHGEDIDVTLPAGNYIVGKDIPEGTYKVTNLSGFGAIDILDHTNRINILYSLIEDGEQSDYFSSFIEDVRLYQGARVEIDSDTMRFESQNGRNDLLESRIKNTLTEEYTISSSVMIGDNIPSGTYDIIAISGEGDVQSENYQFGIHMEMSANDDYYAIKEYKQVKLMDYDKLEVEEGLTIKLVPSEYVIEEEVEW